MNTQISLKLSERMLTTAKTYAEQHGFDSLQDFIREILRETLFEETTDKDTYLASEQALAKAWLTKEEDDAWAHLQKET